MALKNIRNTLQAAIDANKYPEKPDSGKMGAEVIDVVDNNFDVSKSEIDTITTSLSKSQTVGENFGDITASLAATAGYALKINIVSDKDLFITGLSINAVATGIHYLFIIDSSNKIVSSIGEFNCSTTGINNFNLSSEVFLKQGNKIFIWFSGQIYIKVSSNTFNRMGLLASAPAVGDTLTEGASFSYDVGIELATYYNSIPESINDSNIDSKLQFDVTVVKNLYNKDTMGIPDTGINNVGNIGTYVGWEAGKIPVVAGETYSFKHFNNVYNSSIGLMAYMDANSDVLSTVDMSTLDDAGGLGGKTFTAPANCAYIFRNVIVLSTNYKDTLQLELGTSTTSYEPYSEYVGSIRGKTVTNLPKSLADSIFLKSGQTKPIEQLNLVIMGDSLSSLNPETNRWLYYLTQVLKFGNVVNYASGGCTWSHVPATVYSTANPGGVAGDNNVIWNQYNRMVADVTAGSQPTPDVIFIFAGTNDITRTIGSADAVFATGETVLDLLPGEVLDVATAVRYVNENILSSYPNAQVIHATPIQRGLSDNSFVRNVSSEIEKCCDYLSASCIRSDKRSGIYGFNEISADVFLYDNLHTNADGAKKLSSFFAKELVKSIYI